MKRWIQLYELAAGACDAATGLLLLLAPRQTLALMHVSIAPAPIAFMRYIGVFVLGVGSSYLWMLLRWKLTRESVNAWQAQWQITALMRMLVAGFLLCEVATHRMEAAWALVAATDGLLALIQVVGLWRGWLDRAV